MVSDIVVAEIAYVLVSSGIETSLAAGFIERLLDLPGVEVVDEVLRFPHALVAGISDSSVLSLDRDLDRVEGVTRLDLGVVGGYIVRDSHPEIG